MLQCFGCPGARNLNVFILFSCFSAQSLIHMQVFLCFPVFPVFPVFPGLPPGPWLPDLLAPVSHWAVSIEMLVMGCCHQNRVPECAARCFAVSELIADCFLEGSGGSDSAPFWGAGRPQNPQKQVFSNREHEELPRSQFSVTWSFVIA